MLKTSAAALSILTALFISAEINGADQTFKMVEGLIEEIKELIDDLKAE